MARVTAAKAQATKTGLLEAANQVLRAQGYAGLTTRGVAGVAGVPMSQIQYHFGSKEGMVLALFEYMNAQLLERQNAMFADPSLTLSEQWDLACDYLDDDLAAGYVRVLQELLAVGWTDPEIGRVVRDGVMGWIELLTDLARRAQDTYGSLGPFTPEDIATLVGAAFIGMESYLLLGIEERGLPLRRSLRRFGEVIRVLEERGNQGRK
jgi:AcrR family transcriptional regulator